MSNKQVIVQSCIEAVNIIDTPIPTPGDKDVVIKVVVAGCNPKDWKYPLWKDLPHNSGDDMAGIVHSVGKDVYEFSPGDRVAAFHRPATPNGAFAEYSIAPDWMTFHLPHNVSFEEGATVPTAALTAAVALYADMKLPEPFNSEKAGIVANERNPMLIYGVSSAVGAFAAKLARLSGIGPIIGVAGRASKFAAGLVDYVIDYRNGEDALVAAVNSILAKEKLGNKLPYIFDAISEGGSLEATLRIIEPSGGVVSTALPPKFFAKDKENFAYPPGVKAINSVLPIVISTRRDFGYIWSRYLGRLLEDGRLTCHPYEVVPGGLNGVLPGLQMLKDGKASGVKYVYRIEDTAGDVPLGMQGKQEIGEKGENKHPMRDFPLPSSIQ